MTIKDIAQLAGVSTSTVSKIVNGKDENINAGTRERVLKIVKEYNYTPYGTVKNASEAKTFILGILLKTAAKTNHFINGVVSTAQSCGYRVLLCDSMDSQETELKNIASLCKNNVDGVIWEPVCSESLAYERYFKKSNIEICCINSQSDYPSYSIDFSSIGYAATEFLLHYGHAKAACLTKPGSIRSDLVFDGFRRCLFDYSIPYNDSMKLSTEDDGWYDAILSHTPTGIVSTHYASALILMEQLSRRRFQVPLDLSLVSLRGDAREDAELSCISSIKIPYCEFGAFACRRLIEKCEKKEEGSGVFQTECVLDNTSSLGKPFSSHASKIIVVGSIHIDVTLNVDELPQPGRTVSAAKHSVIPGGKGANQAIGVARLGSKAVLIGKVGSDYESLLVYACMEENHVDIQGLKRVSGEETGKAYIHVQNDGESMITLLSGANEKLCPDDIAPYENAFETADYCLLQTEIPEKAVEAAAVIAKKYGVINILKPAAMNRISPSLMKLIDIFVPNRKEAEVLCPDFSDIEDKAEEFIRRGAKAVIITLGHSGCYIKSQGFTGYIPAAPFTPVDTTGAADAFIAAMAVYLCAGRPIEKAAKIAAYAAGFCVLRQGVIPALIDKNTLETYIKRIEPGIL